MPPRASSGEAVTSAAAASDGPATKRRDPSGPTDGTSAADQAGETPVHDDAAGDVDLAEAPTRRALPTQDLGEVPTEEPTPPSTTQAVVMAVTNQKGGVGKTTTTVSLGAALAAEGHDVLVVDLDPQGNATTGLGLRVSEGAPSTYRVIVEQMPLEDAAEPTAVRRLHIVPSSLDLAGAEIELVPQFSREHRLRTALDAVRDQYDVVLIDCPPSLGLLTVNALVASDQVLVPIQCEYYALEGLGQLMRTIEMVRSGLNGALQVGGVLMTMYDGRTNLSQQVVDEVRAHFGELAFGTVIPRTVRLSEAPSYGQPITEFDPSSRGARAYQRLARELARRLGLSDGGTTPVSALDALLGTGPEPQAPLRARAGSDRPPLSSDDAPESPLVAGGTTGGGEPDVAPPSRRPADPDASGLRSAASDDVMRDDDGEMFHVDPSSTTPDVQEGPTWQR